MSTEILSGVAGSARRVQSIYTGVGGSARKVAKVYTGVNGVARLSWESYSPEPPPLNPVFGENSWEAIGAAIASDRIPSTWAVGDEKEITLTTGHVTTLQIYGIKHDDLPGGGKASFTLGMKYLGWWRQHMNAIHINTGGFAASAMSAWLSGWVWNQLPASLRAIVKPAIKRTSAGGMSSVITADELPIFLFSEVEVFGTATQSFAGEGVRYEAFERGLTGIIKREHNGGGLVREWWLRSPAILELFADGYGFCTVNANGAISRVAAGLNRDFCFGVCI